MAQKKGDTHDHVTDAGETYSVPVVAIPLRRGFLDQHKEDTVEKQSRRVDRAVYDTHKKGQKA